MDLPGHGRSAWREDGDYGPKFNAEAVEPVVRNLAPDADLVVNTGREGVTATVTWPDPGRGEGRAPPPAPVTHQLKA